MVDYRLQTTWRIEAPLADVYAAIHDSLAWPAWWSAVKKVEQLEAGDAAGIGNLRRYAWQGKLPYRLSFDVRTTRIEAPVAIEGVAHGDLEGVGRWYFSRRGGVSIVRYEWHVHSTRRWMNLVSPLARALFIRNHVEVMAQGGASLARRLGATLVAEETVDLMAAGGPLPVAPGRLRERGRVDPKLAVLVGLGAGVIATVVQMALWWLAAMPVAETLVRDARLTAALLMGPGVLQATSKLPSTLPWALQWDILLVATLIHFALSIIYALIPSHFAARLRFRPALLIGAFYGLAIYVVNLYGFTVLFPWFAAARNWPTLLAHLVFGASLAGGCQLFSARR